MKVAFAVQLIFHPHIPNSAMLDDGECSLVGKIFLFFSLRFENEELGDFLASHHCAESIEVDSMNYLNIPCSPYRKMKNEVSENFHKKKMSISR